MYNWAENARTSAKDKEKRPLTKQKVESACHSDLYWNWVQDVPSVQRSTRMILIHLQLQTILATAGRSYPVNININEQVHSYQLAVHMIGHAEAIWRSTSMKSFKMLSACLISQQTRLISKLIERYYLIASISLWPPHARIHFIKSSNQHLYAYGALPFLN